MSSDEPEVASRGLSGENPDERPDECACDDLNEFIDLPCWPCYRDGFEEPASGVSEDA